MVKIVKEYSGRYELEKIIFERYTPPPIKLSTREGNISGI